MPISAAVAGLPVTPMPTPHVAAAIAARTTNCFLGRLSGFSVRPPLLTVPAGPCAHAAPLDSSAASMMLPTCVVFIRLAPVQIVRAQLTERTEGTVLSARYFRGSVVRYLLHWIVLVSSVKFEKGAQRVFVAVFQAGGE